MTVREQLLVSKARAEHLAAEETDPLVKSMLEAYAQDLSRAAGLANQSNGTAPSPMIRVATRPQPRIKGSVSMTQAVKDVLMEDRSALRIETILERARARGAVTEAADPIGATDILLQKFRTRDKLPVQRVAPRTWQWITPESMLQA